MRFVWLVLVLSTTLPVVSGGVVLFYVRPGEVYLASDVDSSACQSDGTPHSLVFAGAGVGQYFDPAFDGLRPAADLIASPEEAAQQYGERVLRQWQPIWSTRRADVLASVQRAGFRGTRPSLHQFCFAGLDGTRTLTVACSEILYDTRRGLELQTTPAKRVTFETSEGLLAFGDTVGIPQAAVLLEAMHQQKPSRILRQLIDQQRASIPGRIAPRTAILRLRTDGAFQWQSEEDCGSARRPGKLAWTSPRRASRENSLNVPVSVADKSAGERLTTAAQPGAR